MALLVSVVVTLIALILFGFVKGLTGVNPQKSGGQTILVGVMAIAVAFLLTRLIGLQVEVFQRI